MLGMLLSEMTLSDALNWQISRTLFNKMLVMKKKYLCLFISHQYSVHNVPKLLLINQSKTQQVKGKVRSCPWLEQIRF